MNAFEKILIGAIIIAVILNIALYFNLKPECFENFPALYINLDHREDRKNQIESELKKIKFNNYQRFNADKNKKGYLGCSQSHIDCLKIAKANNYPNVMILEDDFEFLIDKDEFKMILNHLLTVEYDVFILAYNNHSNDITDTGDKYLKKIRGTQTTSGYIVNQRYYDKLIANFEEGLRLLKQTDNQEKYAIDQYWKLIQPDDKWFVYKRIGKQRESFSDIQNANVNYNV
jgi:glycosyl transferase family 25